MSTPQDTGRSVTSHQRTPSIYFRPFEFRIRGPGADLRATNIRTALHCLHRQFRCAGDILQAMHVAQAGKRDKISVSIDCAAVCMQPMAHARLVAAQAAAHVSRPVCWVTLQSLLCLAAGSPYGHREVPLAERQSCLIGEAAGEEIGRSSREV